MRVIARDNAPRLAMGLGLVLIGILVGLLIGRAWGPTPVTGQAIETATPTAAPAAPQASASPSSGVASPSGAGASSLPATLPEPSLAPDADAVVAIWRAIDRLAVLRAYRFDVGIAGRSPLRLEEPSDAGFRVKGDLVHQPELAVNAVYGTQMVEFNGDAAISSSQRFVLVGDTYWVLRPGASPSPAPIGNDGDELALILPEGFASKLIVPFAAAYQRVGPAPRHGVAAVHYRLTEAGARRYASATNCDGTWTGDLWIADAGYLAAAELLCVAPAPSSTMGLGLQVLLEVTDPDDPSIVVVPPR